MIMSRQADIDRVWDIIEKVGICMLTTQFPGGVRARRKRRDSKGESPSWARTAR
jgi:hypothetical protein